MLVLALLACATPPPPYSPPIPPAVAEPVEDDEDDEPTDTGAPPAPDTGPPLDPLDADDAFGRLEPVELVDVRPLGDVDRDGVAEIAVSARTVDGGGAVYLFGGLAANAELADAYAVIRGAPRTRSGEVLGGGGDLDGDGAADLVIRGAYHSRDVFLVSGVTGGESAATDHLRIDGGSGRLATGDVDGDGSHDLISADPRADIGASGAGAAYVYRGPFREDRSFADVDHVVVGTDTDYGVGHATLLADVDGDGRDDVLVGACDYGWSGRVHVLRDVEARTLWAEDGELLTEVGCYDGGIDDVGDVNGDGHLDLIASTGGADTAAVILHGPIDGDRSAADATARLSASVNALIVIVSGLGDVDADGFPDAAVRAKGEAGTVVLVHGPFEGTRPLEPRSDTRFITGDGVAHGFGWWIEAAGDADADGAPDLLVGALGEDYPVETERLGGVFLFGGDR